MTKNLQMHEYLTILIFKRRLQQICLTLNNTISSINEIIRMVDISLQVYIEILQINLTSTKLRRCRS